jgi:hypothetical protein
MDTGYEPYCATMLDVGVDPNAREKKVSFMTSHQFFIFHNLSKRSQILSVLSHLLSLAIPLSLFISISLRLEDRCYTSPLKMVMHH